MVDFSEVLKRNKVWADKIKEYNSSFFEDLSQQQNPEFLWIGCADSRVPANQIVDLPPGEVFVHRNIANVVAASDLNCLSVLQYAVEVLGVKHIIVCGHYGCGGIKAAMGDDDNGLIDNWLNHIRDVRTMNQDQFEDGMSEDEKFDRMCELNVKAQLGNVCRTTIVRNAWKAKKDLSVHGVIYSLKNGILHHLETRSGSENA